MYSYSNDKIEQAYKAANEIYAAYGVDTDKAMEELKKIPVSIHCWQGDDVAGFENLGGSSGGIMATGNYPGRARNGEELRQDMDKALSLIPGKNRVNLHAMYAETNGKKVGRDEITFEHFEKWVEWAKEKVLGLILILRF